MARTMLGCCALGGMRWLLRWRRASDRAACAAAAFTPTKLEIVETLQAEHACDRRSARGVSLRAGQPAASACRSIRPRTTTTSASSTTACATPATSGSRPPTATRARCISLTARSRPTGTANRAESARRARRSARASSVREARAARLSRVAHGGKSVTFALNDLSQVKPPAGHAAAGRDVSRADLRRVRHPFFPGVQLPAEGVPLSCSMRPKPSPTSSSRPRQRPAS